MHASISAIYTLLLSSHYNHFLIRTISQTSHLNMKKSFDQEIQDIANQIKSDVEKQLHKAFDTFDVVEHQSLKNDNPQGSSYSMKVKTDDKDQSNLRLSTWRNDPFSDWQTTIDEFWRGASPFDNLLSKFDPYRVGFNSIQGLADRIKKDVEKDLNRTFSTFDVTESHPILTDPEHTSYYMRVKTDDNGHVRVKTIKKNPGSDWQTHIEEYNRGKPSLEGQKGEKGKALESKGGKMETEKEGRRQEKETMIQEEPYKASNIQPSA